MFGRFGWAEILIIVVLVVILFGSHKIPSMMHNLASGINIFKKELKKDSDGGKEKKAAANKTKTSTRKKPVAKSKKAAK